MSDDSVLLLSFSFIIFGWCGFLPIACFPRPPRSLPRDSMGKIYNGVFFFSFHFSTIFDAPTDEAARQALDWGLMELQEFLEDEELALGVKGEGPGNVQLWSFGSTFLSVVDGRMHSLHFFGHLSSISTFS